MAQMEDNRRRVGRMKATTLEAARAAGIALNEPQLNGTFKLVPVGPWILERRDLIGDMARWRSAARDKFFVRFPVSTDGMRDYLQRVSIREPDAILFVIEHDPGDRGLGNRGADGASHPFVGHLGLTRVTDDAAHIDSVMKSDRGAPSGLMSVALAALIAWAHGVLGITRLELKVISTNPRAIRLYERHGFHIVEQRPLRRIDDDERVYHQEVAAGESNVDYTCLIMARRIQ